MRCYITSNVDHHSASISAHADLVGNCDIGGRLSECHGMNGMVEVLSTTFCLELLFAVLADSVIM